MGKFSDRVGKRSGARKQMQQGKISVRLLEFAQPLIEGLVEEMGTAITEEQFRTVLKLAVTIWNAQVLEQVGKGARYIDEVRRLLGSIPGPEEGGETLDALMHRKAKLFPGDMRYIGDFSVYRDSVGELRIEAEACLDAGLLDEH